MNELMKDCEVCAVLPKNQPLFETDNWMVSLSPDQGYLGRSYVTLKRHEGDLASLSNDEWVEFAEILRKFESAVKEAFNAEVFNWGCLMNNAYQVEPALPHIHWHVRPRYRSDVAVNDTTFSDPLFGYHYDRSQSNVVSDITLSVIRETIQAHLSTK